MSTDPSQESNSIEASIDSFEKYLKKIRAESACRIEKIGHVGDIAIVKHEIDSRWQMILPDVSGGEFWRIQSFDHNGFSGHCVFKDKATAIKDAASSRFTERDDEALDRIQDTPAFQLGLYACEQIQLLNFGEISYTVYLNRIADYRLQTSAALA